MLMNSTRGFVTQLGAEAWHQWGVRMFRAVARLAWHGKAQVWSAVSLLNNGACAQNANVIVPVSRMHGLALTMRCNRSPREQSHWPRQAWADSGNASGGENATQEEVMLE